MPKRTKSSAAPPPVEAAFPIRHHLIRAGVVFALAFAVRLIVLLSSVDRTWPHAINYEGDAVIWARAADLFAHGQVPDEGVPHRFYAIAYLFHWLHPAGLLPSYVTFKVGWCALSALTWAGAYLTFARNFSARVTAIATGLGVFSFGSYVLATSLNVEGLYAPVLVAILGGTLELARRPRWRWAVPLAVLNALALLVREEHVVLLFLSSAYLIWIWHWRAAGKTDPVPGGTSSGLRVAMVASIAAGAIALCLPYSVHATRATQHYNQVPKRPPDYERAKTAGVVWPPGAREFIESLPAFVRAKTVDFVSQQCAQRGVAAVSPELARQLLLEVFDPPPEPLSTPVFIASHGPMSFALANHPESNGGFSRAALATQGQREPRLNLTAPAHLRIFNHGYRVGWGYITADLGRWLGNVVLKLGHAYQGAALGFTAYNLPYGRYGERRACDVVTPIAGAGLWWQLGFAALLILGVRALAIRRQRGAGLWLLVVGYKLAIVVVYYGYARQFVSILPVFLLLAALGIDQLVTWLGPRIRLAPTPRTRQGLALGLVAVALVVELHAATHPRQFHIEGMTQPTSEWGAEAFSANAPIQIQALGN